MDAMGKRPRTTVSGGRLDGSEAPPTSPRGRHCAEPDCETALSIYNAGLYCSQHGQERIVVRGRRKAS